jgi:hypothetical protein
MLKRGLSVTALTTIGRPLPKARAVLTVSAWAAMFSASESSSKAWICGVTA